MSGKGSRRLDDLVAACDSWATEADAFFDPDIVRMFLEFRAEYLDGRLTSWSAQDLLTLLMGVFPAKVMLDDEEVADVVPAARTFIEFLAATGRLSKVSEPLDHLLETLDEIEGEFEEEMAGSGAVGLAKQVLMAMTADDVDVSDPASVQGWLEDFNARPEPERRALIPFPPPPLVSSRLDLPPDVRIPMVALAPEDELVRAVGATPLWKRLCAFVGWVGSGRKLTDAGRIKLRDIPELIEILGLGPVPAGVEFRSSSQLPELDWTYGLADAGLLVDVTPRGVVTTELGRTMDERPLEAWASALDGLLAVGAVVWLRGVRAWQPPWAPGLDANLADLLVLAYLGREAGMTVDEVVDAAWKALAADGITLRAAMRESLARDVRALVGVLADLGLAERLSDRLVLTPLGTWGVNRLLREEGYDAPAFTEGPEVDLASRIAYWAGLDFEGDELPDAVDAWLAGRTPQAAVVELAVAASTDRRLRGMFLYALERMGSGSADAITEVEGKVPPAMGAYLRAWMAGQGPGGQEPPEEDLVRVMADQLALILEEEGPQTLIAMVEGLGPAAEQVAFLRTLARLEGAESELIAQTVSQFHPDPVVARAARKASLSTVHAGPSDRRDAAVPRRSKGRSARPKKKPRRR